MRRLLPVLLAAAALAAPAAVADPIPEGPNSSPPPSFIGAPAAQQPIPAPTIPRHPFMAPNERSNIHVDAYQTDADFTPGPLGRGMSRLSTFQSADCASVTFDSRGRIVTVCVGIQGPRLMMFDSRTLATLATFDLPGRQPGVTNPFTDFGGGGYFYLDDQDRAVVPTTTRHLYVVAELPNGQPGFTLARDYDLSSKLVQGDSIESALPDWSGRLWFASVDGVVGDIDPVSGTVLTYATKETIGNSFAVDETGAVYVVTDSALYRFDAAADGAPAVTWRATYANDGRSKPGQTEVGSGTTPTVMGGGYVAITDNADPIDIVVYRKAKSVGGSRLVCVAPLFSKGASDTDQSLNAAGNALVAENNYGYSSPAAVEEGRTTTPGLERVDVNPDGSGCHKVWHSDEIAPTVVPKTDLANGLVYTYTHPGGDSSDPWYFTALDFRTGRTVYKFLAGEGLGFNNNYAPITIGPDGTAYIGVLGGLAAVRDATPPPQPPAIQPPRPPRLTLHLRRLRGCMIGASLRGRDGRLARSVVFRAGRHRARVGRRPFRHRLRVPARRHGTWISARVTLRDGARVTLRRRVKRCGARPRYDRAAGALAAALGV